MADQIEYMGVVKLFAGNYAPQDYMFCAGQLLNIADYQALYSILGTFYGGDGRVTFALPDLRGAVPIGQGYRIAPPTQIYRLGQMGGQEFTQLSVQQMPQHTHSATFAPTGGGAGTPITATVTVNAGTAGTTTNDPTGAYWGKSPGTGPQQSQDYTNTKSVRMASDAVQVSVSGGGGGITGGTVTVNNAGLGNPFSNLQPFTVLSYIICVNGLYPPQP